MSNTNGLYSEGAETFSPKVNSIPLRDADTRTAGEGSIGDLVSDATAQMSNLFRAEVELAKAEIAQEAKKGAIGGGLFGVAGTIALYSSFFFFFFLAELLALWLPKWSAFLIIFLVMLLVAAVLALVGWRKIKTIGKPEKTVQSVSELKTVMPSRSGSKERRGIAQHSEAGLYT